MADYCTLFDSNYLSRGVLMYRSMMKHEPQSSLYVYAFDDKCAKVLKQMNLPNLIVVTLKEFENEALLKTKATRTAAEYCWTCTPSIIHHAIITYGLPSCTYLDADLLFYAPPSSLIDEMPADRSVLITPHRYTKEYDQSATSGIYCVQFMTFKNNADGMKVLEWWRDACLEWCYNRFEDGKFGDQKYLDEWPEKFGSIVWSLKNPGGGVAPWNVQQYEFSCSNELMKGTVLATGEKFTVIFFHFHGLSFRENVNPFGKNITVVYRTGYTISQNAEQLIYIPYAQQLLAEAKKVSKENNIPIRCAGTDRIGLTSYIKQKIKIFLRR